MENPHNMFDSIKLFPVKTVYNGTACGYCENASPNLVACSACRVTVYCGKDCQTKSWKKENHKYICKTLNAFRKSYAELDTPKEQYGVMALLNHFEDNSVTLMEDIEKSKRLSKKDYNTIRQTVQHYIRGCRICSICHKTEYDVPIGKTRKWRHCSECHFGWCCSDKHWNEYYESKHTREICYTYKESIEIERFGHSHIRMYKDTFLEVPRMPLVECMDVFPSCWSDYFSIRCPDSWNARDRLPSPYFKEATRELSQPVNCLRAMYMHGIDHFKELSTLTIHIVGAGPTYEFKPAPTMVWEEILHCLPNVKTLNIIFVGPELYEVASPPTVDEPLSDIQACPDCIGKGRVRRQGWHAKTWHEYYNYADSFVKPDLIVAFNTGMSMEDTFMWETSLELILDKNIPCLATMYNDDEARKDYGLLKSLGAHTLTDRALVNPFSVSVPDIDPSETDGFFKINNYYVCFKGRST